MDSDNLLFVSHPGHELFAYGWLAQTGASLCVLTDGSGHEHLPRVQETVRVIDLAEAKRGCLWGTVADQCLYESFLEQEADQFVSGTLQLAETLVEKRVKTFICDALEFQILAHDLAYVMAETAVAIAESRGHRVEFYQLPIYKIEEAVGREGSLRVRLDEATLEDKMRATKCYKSVVLQGEIDHFIKARGRDSFALETFIPAVSSLKAFETIEKPQWESHGEAMQDAGRYKEVIRLREHFLPMMEKIWALARDGERVVIESGEGR